MLSELLAVQVEASALELRETKVVVGPVPAVQLEDLQCFCLSERCFRGQSNGDAAPRQYSVAEKEVSSIPQNGSYLLGRERVHGHPLAHLE